jgi:hypothetical protein
MGFGAICFGSMHPMECLIVFDLAILRSCRTLNVCLFVTHTVAKAMASGSAAVKSVQSCAV